MIVHVCGKNWPRGKASNFVWFELVGLGELGGVGTLGVLVCNCLISSSTQLLVTAWRAILVFSDWFSSARQTLFWIVFYIAIVGWLGSLGKAVWSVSVFHDLGVGLA